jgi:hypothetical protein
MVAMLYMIFLRILLRCKVARVDLDRVPRLSYVSNLEKGMGEAHLFNMEYVSNGIRGTERRGTRLKLFVYNCFRHGRFTILAA